MLPSDDPLLRHAVEALLGADSAFGSEPIVVEVIPSTGGGAFNTTVQRLSTTGATPWSVVVKHLEGGSPDWDREVDVYADAEWLGAALPIGLRLPRLLAVERSERSATLILEDVQHTRPPRIDDLANAARQLTAFHQGGHGARPWWSAGVLDHEFDSMANRPERLTQRRAEPKIEELRQQLMRLLSQAGSLLASCEDLPLGPAHLDAYSRNLIAEPENTGLCLVDWANAGVAPLGADPATIFVLTLNYLDVDAAAIDEFKHAVVNAMLTGLTDTGSSHLSDVALEGFSSIARLRHLAMMMNALPMVEAGDPAVSAIVGRPLDEIIDQWLTIGQHLTV